MIIKILLVPVMLAYAAIQLAISLVLMAVLVPSGIVIAISKVLTNKRAEKPVEFHTCEEQPVVSDTNPHQSELVAALERENAELIAKTAKAKQFNATNKIPPFPKSY